MADKTEKCDKEEIFERIKNNIRGYCERKKTRTELALNILLEEAKIKNSIEKIGELMEQLEKGVKDD